MPPKEGVRRRCAPPKGGDAPQPPLPEDRGAPPIQSPFPGGPSLRAPLSEGGAAPPHPSGSAARPLPSPDCPWLGTAAPRAPLVRSRRRGGFAARSAGRGGENLFPRSVHERSCSVRPPHPPPQRLGRRLLGRGPSRPRRPPHCVSLTGSASPAPAPRNRKPPQRHSGPRAPPMPARRTPRGEAPPPPRDEQAYSPMSGGRAAEWAGIWAGPALWVRRGAGAGPGRPPQPRVGRCGGRSAPAAVALLSPLLSPAMFLLVHNQHREQACEASPYTPGRAIPTLLLPCRPRSTFPRRCVNSRHK